MITMPAHGAVPHLAFDVAANGNARFRGGETDAPSQFRRCGYFLSVAAAAFIIARTISGLGARGAG